jgi:hypothetical protein
MSQDNGLFFIGNCNGAEGFYFSIQPNPPHYISIREFRTPGSSPDLSDLSSRAFSASTTYSISLVSSYSEG